METEGADCCYLDVGSGDWEGNYSEIDDDYVETTTPGGMGTRAM